MSFITIGHGSGGRLTHELIRDVFLKHLGNEFLDKADDSAVVDIGGKKIAFTTDSFVVKPLFFPGGDIGKLSVCGTVNDLAVKGARPLYLTAGFIIEEGFPIADLEKITASMAVAAGEAGVKIVAGDTKVVGKGEADGVFINTSGVGLIGDDVELGIDKIRTGDRIIINGPVGDHGIAILSKRKGLDFTGDISSDCAPLNKMIKDLIDGVKGLRFMRDPTRGGLATTLNEITMARKDIGILISEDLITVSDNVRGASELLGLDPLYIANEGKVIVIADPSDEAAILSIMRANEYGKGASAIGDVADNIKGKVCVRTRLGVVRIIDMLTAEQLPRIC